MGSSNNSNNITAEDRLYNHYKVSYSMGTNNILVTVANFRMTPAFPLWAQHCNLPFFSSLVARGPFSSKRTLFICEEYIIDSNQDVDPEEIFKN